MLLKNLPIILTFFLFINLTFAQSDLDKVLKAGEILLGGLTVIKAAKSNPKSESKVINVLCIKNKLTTGITFRITGQDIEGNDIKKELVVPKEGKECLFKVPKGVYLYEIVLDNKQVYRKGEYNFDDEITMTIKEE